MPKTSIAYEDITVEKMKELKAKGISLAPQGDGKIIELGLEDLEEV